MHKILTSTMVAALAVTSAVAAFDSAPPVRAVGPYAANVTLTPELPATLVYGDPTTEVIAELEFGTTFEAITRVCFQPFFAGDLLDQGEAITFWYSPAGQGGFGIGNNSSAPLETKVVCISDVHNDQIQRFLDGAETLRLAATADEPDYTEASVTLTGLTVWALAVVDENDCTIVGTNRDDTLYGTRYADTICGLGGSDVIYGYAGDDIILGGAGKDRIYGGAGNDSLFGGQAGDKMWGGVGQDVLTGGPGWDRLHGGADRDYIFGEGDPDRAYGQGGDDWIVLGPGDRQVSYGGDGDDFVRGGPARDRLYGGNGNDSLVGEAGDDSLYGGPDNDQLYGGLGDDWLCGQAGVDSIDTGGQPGDRVCRCDRNDG